ncbi:MAG: pilus assembly FimT family protein [Anaerolineales bacterium]
MRKSARGFTLIELLVVMSVIGILFAIGIAQSMNFNRRQILDQAAQELKNNLRLAQTKAASGEKPSGCERLDGYKVKFNNSGSPNYYSLVAVCGGNEISNSEVRYDLPSAVTFSSLPSPVLFKVLAQGTNLNNNLTISLTAFGQSRTVTVTKEGKIE